MTTITRQHSETEVTELNGKTCEALMVTRMKQHPERVSIFHLRVENVWHRFYLDAGLLFWSQGAPHQEDDKPLEGEERADLSIEWAFSGSVIEHISFAREELKFRCSNGGFRVFADGFDGDSICEQLKFNPL